MDIQSDKDDNVEVINSNQCFKKGEKHDRWVDGRQRAMSGEFQPSFDTRSMTSFPFPCFTFTRLWVSLKREDRATK